MSIQMICMKVGFSVFLALLWTVQKNKELKWSENKLPKKTNKKNPNGSEIKKELKRPFQNKQNSSSPKDFTPKLPTKFLPLLINIFTSRLLRSEDIFLTNMKLCR